MKRFMKIISATLVTVLAASLLSGCGKKASGDITEVEIWSGNSHSKTVIDQIINEWNETKGKKKGIHINYVVQPSDTISKNVELALQTGDAPELFTASVKKNSELGYIAALDDMPGGKELIEEHKDRIVYETHAWNGKTYKIPCTATTKGLLYNVDMFKEAGLVDENGEATPPKTFKEMREYAKKLTNVDENKFGIIYPMKWSGWFESDISSMAFHNKGNNGFDYVTGEYDIKILVPVMETFLGMKNDGSVHPGADSIDNDMARAYFAEGNIGMKIGFSFDVGVLNDQFPAKMDWAVAELPLVDENVKYMQTMSCGCTPCINADVLEDPEKAEKVMEVIKFWLSDEFSQKLYLAGLELPVRKDIVENTKLENPPKGWKEFADMVSISVVEKQVPTIPMSGYMTLKDRFIDDVWSGKMTAEKAVEAFEKDREEATKDALKDDPSLIERYLIPDYDVHR